MMDEKNDARRVFRDLLAPIYDSIQKLITLLIDAGVDVSRIPTAGATRDICMAALLEVENQGEARIEKLVQRILADYEGELLINAAERYVTACLGQLPHDTRKILDQWTAAVNVTLPASLDRRQFYYWATDGRVKSYKTAVDAEFRVRSLAEVSSPRNLALLVLPRRNPTFNDVSGTRGVRKILFKWHTDWLDVLPSIDSTKIDSSKWSQHTSGPWSVDQWLSLVDSKHFREGLVRYGIGYHSPRHIGGLVTFKRSPKRQEKGCYHYVLFTAKADIDADRLTDEDGKAYECLSKDDIERHGALVEERDSTNAVIRSFRRRDRFEDPNGDVFRTLERLGWLDANSSDG